MKKEKPTDIKPMLRGFLSDHESQDKMVSIKTEPDIIYVEDARDSNNINFDFIVTGLTDKKLIIKFIKVAVYDEADNLITFKHLNHNAVGVAGIHTIGKFEINGKETFDIFNPFHVFPKDMSINYLRYTFTLLNPDTKDEFYYGNIIIKPKHYQQKVKLSFPIKGLITILDGHDYYSHHRRFGMTLVRKVTENKFNSNFSRFAIDFTLLGPEGDMRNIEKDELSKNYDFHFGDVTKFYTHEAIVYAPADGEIVDIVNHLEDLYETPFNMDESIKDDKIKEIAGNYVIIKHNDREYSHLFHLLKDSISVNVGQKVTRNQPLAKIGFSGASAVYSHLHYQLMNGMDFLNDEPLPCKFSDVELVLGSKIKKYDELSIDTGDFIISK